MMRKSTGNYCWHIPVVFAASGGLCFNPPLHLKPADEPHQDAVFAYHCHLLDNPADKVVLKLGEVKGLLSGEGY